MLKAAFTFVWLVLAALTGAQADLLLLKGGGGSSGGGAGGGAGADGNILLLEDNVSALFLEDNSSDLCLEGSCSTVVVSTAMYDNLRTGWQQNETALTTALVGSSHFGMLASNTTLDGRIDTTPLVVPHLLFGAVFHSVVYVATSNDTIYALDAYTGAVLASRSMGTAVPNNGCTNDNATIGILSTPVIDVPSNTMWLMAYVMITGTPTYQLHAIDLITLADKTAAQTVSASVTLTDATTYNFNATVSRQRTALLRANGNIYAGFASFCDNNASTTRGWLLGWNATTLAPLTSHQLQLLDSVGPAVSITLDSIWQSGGGLAADGSGNIFGVTGNSTSSSYSPPNDIQESLIKVDPTLLTLQDYFTDSGYVSLDTNDADLSGGGVMLLPDQTGPLAHLAMVGGKGGTFYLVNRDSMGHFNATPPNAVASLTKFFNWGQTAYFMGSDGTPRIVTMGADNTHAAINSFNPATDTFGTVVSTASPTVYFGARCNVSSNGTVAGSQILWCRYVSQNNPPTPSLVASNALTGATLFSQAVGTWSNFQASQNGLPTVWNGRVYVASEGQLFIFGLSP